MTLAMLAVLVVLAGAALLAGLRMQRRRPGGLTNEIEVLTRSELAGRGYPPESVPDVHVGFASHEEVVREAKGSYSHHFK